MPRTSPRASAALIAAALILALAVILGGWAPRAAAAVPAVGGGDGGFVLNQVGSFNRPIYADNAPGTKDSLYVVESEGVIRVVNGTTLRPTPFLDISDLVRCCGEEGLLSIAFHPDYRKNRLFYVYFTNALGDNVVMEYKRKRKLRFVAARGSARQVLYLPHPVNSNHNGGQLQFGPDGLLYIAPGDGGGGGDAPNNAQNPNSLLGKLLRIDPRRQRGRKSKGKRAQASAVKPYGIPKKNPFAKSPGRGEIYSLGLRNPFRFSFDARTGAIAIGDVGQSCREEIDYRGRGGARGANFGWSAFEGTVTLNASRAPPRAIGPIHEYDNSAAGAGCSPLGGFNGVSVIAGYVVRDQRLTQQYGRLLYTDVASTDIRSLIPSPAVAVDDQSTGVANEAGSPYSFAEGYAKRLFLISGDGPVYRLDPG